MLYRKTTASTKETENADSSVNITVSDADVSITQAGAAPPLREIRQFDKF
jgi:hypothetical protein